MPRSPSPVPLPFLAQSSVVLLPALVVVRLLVPVLVVFRAVASVVLLTLTPLGQLAALAPVVLLVSLNAVALLFALALLVAAVFRVGLHALPTAALQPTSPAAMAIATAALQPMPTAQLQAMPTALVAPIPLTAAITPTGTATGYGPTGALQFAIKCRSENSWATP
jgi:hypothetical protein